jgi:peroxiredoxin Q/BCP
VSQVARGAIAPDFDLLGTGNKRYRLSDYRGRVVVLVFYPGDNTPVCTVQLSEYSNDIAEFQDLDAVVLGLSPQGLESHEKFKADHNLRMELLVDDDKSVGEAYGIVGPLGFYRRSVFVIDANGIVNYVHRALSNIGFRSTKELLEAVNDAKSDTPT